MAILWGLTAALAWGLTDFLIKPVSMKLGAIRAVFFVEFLSLALLSGYYLLTLGQGSGSSALALGLALLIGLINFGATLALFRAFEIGEVSIISPIASSFSVVTVGLALLVLGERPSSLAGLGIALTLGGVAAVSTPWSELRRAMRLFAAPGLGLALAAAAGFGVVFFLLDFVVDDIGPVVPVLAFRLASVLGLLLTRAISSLNLKFPERSSWPLLGLLVAVDTLGYLTYNLGLGTGYVFSVATVTSLYTLIAVLLAGVFLGERLEINQYVAIVIIFAGIVLLLT